MANNWMRGSAVETAAELRRLPVKDSPVGRWVLHMDHHDQQALYDRYPEMDPAVNDDTESRNKAFMKWMKSSASEPYRTGAKI